MWEVNLNHLPWTKNSKPLIKGVSKWIHQVCSGKWAIKNLSNYIIYIYIFIYSIYVNIYIYMYVCSGLVYSEFHSSGVSSFHQPSTIIMAPFFSFAQTNQFGGSPYIPSSATGPSPHFQPRASLWEYPLWPVQRPPRGWLQTTKTAGKEEPIREILKDIYIYI